MSHSEESKHINIYLNEVDKEQLKKSYNDNPAQTYILISHDKMLKEYNQMKIKLKEIEDVKTALETENERHEKSLSNLRGFVKNLAEIKQLHENLVKKYSMYQNDTRNILIDQYKLVYELISNICIYLIFTFLVYIILWGLGYISNNGLFSICVIHGSKLVKDWGEYKKEIPYFKSIKFNLNIKDTLYHTMACGYLPGIQEIKIKLKDIEKGNDFLSDPLHELIDIQ